jgi:predicted phosphodiesterase
MVFVTGDTHGDPERLSKSVLKDLNEGDTLIVCGDFGYIFDFKTGIL